MEGGEWKEIMYKYANAHMVIQLKEKRRVSPSLFILNELQYSIFYHLKVVRLFLSQDSSN